jgi:hypothetical protein
MSQEGHNMSKKYWLTSDLLLPKLISGEVDVENIEIRITENGSERT